MKRLKLSQDWLNELLPGGLPYPGTTLISGPGGSGKPLVGFAFAYDWLKTGGNTIFIPLQYPKMEIVKTALKQLYYLNIEQYSHQIAYIQFNPYLEKYKKVDGNIIEANLVKSDVWDVAISEAENILTKRGGLGTLIFASALNLLLFSPTYQKLNLDKLEKIIRDDKTRTYILSVSTSAFKEEIERWEEAADNLMFARMGESMKLYLKTAKIENKDSLSREIQVPVSREILEDIKEVAEHTRQRQIPILRGI
ncbi:MAG: ATPase domain-containing protein [Candidatus Auribacterota bacterium]|nr:ATPase domain-containing protein [Candidatus Auribacterota bacterium]